MDYASGRFPQALWNKDAYVEFKEVIERLDRLDKHFGQPDCHDPEKAAFLNDIEHRIFGLEQKAGINKST